MFAGTNDSVEQQWIDGSTIESELAIERLEMR